MMQIRILLYLGGPPTNSFVLGPGFSFNGPALKLLQIVTLFLVQIKTFSKTNFYVGKVQ